MTTFVDTNVLVSTRDAGEPDKQPQAKAWMQHLWEAGTGRTSMQVLNEYYVTVTRKLSPGLDVSIARSDVGDLAMWQPSAVDHAIVIRAWELEDQYSLSWWDSLIVASAMPDAIDSSPRISKTVNASVSSWSPTHSGTLPDDRCRRRGAPTRPSTVTWPASSTPHTRTAACSCPTTPTRWELPRTPFGSERARTHGVSSDRASTVGSDDATAPRTATPRRPR